MPGLVCFWDFQGTPQGGAGDDLTAAGPHAYALTEMNGPVARVGGGVFGPAALRIERGQWLRIPREECPALLLSGEDRVTVAAWVKRRADVHWQYIAGVWDELHAARQYALFTCGHRQADWRTLDPHALRAAGARVRLGRRRGHAGQAVLLFLRHRGDRTAGRTLGHDRLHLRRRRTSRLS